MSFLLDGKALRPYRPRICSLMNVDGRNEFADRVLDLYRGVDFHEKIFLADHEETRWFPPAGIIEFLKSRTRSSAHTSGISGR